MTINEYLEANFNAVLASAIVFQQPAICAQCKKVQDDKGYWSQIESYIQQHPDADFSHSICPDCARKLYPDINLDDD